MESTRTGNPDTNRGFAAMSDERQREIARKGGRAAHAKGTAHEFTSDEARAAGQKGGQRVSANREHMSRIGRIGGKKSAGRRQEMRASQSDPNPGQLQASQPDEAQRGDSSDSLNDASEARQQE